MTLWLLIACLVAKCKKYRVWNTLRDRSFFPLYFMELLYLSFQLVTILGNYNLIKYASFLQFAFIAVLIFPILKFHIYIPAIIGACCTVVGSFLNKLVIAVNQNRMPIYPTLSRWTGYCDEEVLLASGDTAHLWGFGADVNLPFLGDYIDIGFSVLSPGDVLIHLMTTIVVFYCIKQSNKSYKNDLSVSNQA